MKNLELTNLHCPFCKKRIGTWSRRAKKVESLIDQKLWTRIQKDFPNEVQARLKGSASTLFDEGGFSHDFTFEDGAIRKEFEEQMAQMQEEDQRRRDKEMAESKKLIAALQLEDQAEVAANGNGVHPDPEPEPPAEFLEAQRRLEAQIEQQKKDEQLARRLQQQLKDHDFSPGGGPRTRSSPRASSSAKKSKGPRQLTLEETLRPSKKRKLDTDMASASATS